MAEREKWGDTYRQAKYGESQRSGVRELGSGKALQARSGVLKIEEVEVM